MSQRGGHEDQRCFVLAVICIAAFSGGFSHSLSSYFIFFNQYWFCALWGIAQE